MFILKIKYYPSGTEQAKQLKDHTIWCQFDEERLITFVLYDKVILKFYFLTEVKTTRKEIKAFILML